MRGVVLKGSTYADLRGEFLWLVGILVLLVVLSSVGFRTKIG